MLITIHLLINFSYIRELSEKSSLNSNAPTDYPVLVKPSPPLTSVEDRMITEYYNSLMPQAVESSQPFRSSLIQAYKSNEYESSESLNSGSSFISNSSGPGSSESKNENMYMSSGEPTPPDIQKYYQETYPTENFKSQEMQMYQRQFYAKAPNEMNYLANNQFGNYPTAYSQIPQMNSQNMFSYTYYGDAGLSSNDVEAYTASAYNNVNPSYI